jgi:hypothetical protein
MPDTLLLAGEKRTGEHLPCVQVAPLSHEWPHAPQFVGLEP